MLPKSIEINTKSNQVVKPNARSDIFTRKYKGFVFSVVVLILTPFLVTSCVAIFNYNSRTFFFITMSFPSETL